MKTQNLILISLAVAGAAWFCFGKPEKDPLTTRADLARNPNFRIGTRADLYEYRDQYGNLYR